MRMKRLPSSTVVLEIRATCKGALAGAVMLDRAAMPTLPLGRISGRALAALVTAMRKTPARAPLTRLFRAQLGIDALRALSPEARAPLPFSHAPLRAATATNAAPELDLGRRHPSWPRPSGEPRRALPSSLAIQPGRGRLARSRMHVRLASVLPTLGPLCGYDDEHALVAAEESARRFAEGNARSELEGVPIAVKEEVDTAGFTTRMGSNLFAAGAGA